MEKMCINTVTIGFQRVQLQMEGCVAEGFVTDSLETEEN